MIGDFTKWLHGENAKNVNAEKSDKLEFYEDTHKDGQYVGSSTGTGARQLPDQTAPQANRQYQNVVVYAPKTPDDVEKLINYLKRKEPAIINLDDVLETTAQRILDFVSGAMFALNGSMHCIATNIFLLSPEGVEITIPFEK